MKRSENFKLLWKRGSDMLTTGIIPFAPAGPMGDLERLDDFPDWVLESDQPTKHGHTYFEDSKHGFAAGVWDCTPVVGAPHPYAFNEFMLILEGSVTIIEPGGRETTIRSGEALAIPQGLICQWKQTEYVRKYYTIFEETSRRQALNYT